VLLAAAAALAVAGPATRCLAQQPTPFAGPAALEWRVVFKLIDATAVADPGQAGFVRQGDDTRESNQQTLRVQLTGQPLLWLDYRLDYLNVKQNLAGSAPPGASGAGLFRRDPWRKYIEAPTVAGGQASTQTVQWYHELDDAFVRIAGGPVEATLGRQPISWGAGRIWQPTDVFAAFSPLALDTEFKPGIDGLLLNAYPFSFATVQLAYILHPQDDPTAEDSTALRWRGQVGTVSELTVLAGRVRGESLAGGSFETDWLQSGWRVEAIASRPQGRDGTAVYGIAGVDHQLSDSTVLLAELYHHSLGAERVTDLPAVLQSRTYREGRLLQLSRSVLGLVATRDFLGLWNGSYGLFAASLRDADGVRRTSLLHQLTFTYSVSDNASAVFSLSAGSGRGLAADGTPQSEFGHVPKALYVSLQFVL